MENQVFIDAKVVNAFFTGDDATRDALSKIYPQMDFTKQAEAIKKEIHLKSGAIIADLRRYFNSENEEERRIIKDRNKDRNMFDFDAIYNEVFLSVCKKSLDFEFQVDGKTYRLYDVNKLRNRNPNLIL